MSMQLGTELGRKLCHQLGIDPKRVLSITLHCRAGDIATVTVEMFDFDGDEMVVALEHYRLAHIDTATSGATS